MMDGGGIHYARIQWLQGIVIGDEFYDYGSQVRYPLADLPPLERGEPVARGIVPAVLAQARTVPLVTRR